MSYRAWPSALLTGAALAAACVVVGEHVVDASDGCLDSAGWFTATPAAAPADPNGPPTTNSGPNLPYLVSGSGGRADGKPSADKTGLGQTGMDDSVPSDGQPGTTDEVGQTSRDRPFDGDQISGCLDLDRIEIPAPAPVPDGRA